jgi:trans-aconitate 2-methyltransferase
MADVWDPAQYERFRDERSHPFFDLVALVRPRPGMRVVDLGCGTGELTRLLHGRLEARETVGLDSSEAMLEQARPRAGGGLRFEQGDVAAWDGRDFDLVFSNAALHWVEDHDELFTRLRRALTPGGQIAVQVPANHEHPSQTVAVAVAREEPFRQAFRGWTRVSPVQPPAAYAEVLERLGFAEQHVRLQVYGHRLESRDEVVEWLRGTTLTDYQRRLEPALWDAFLARYRERLMPRLPERRPYFFTFQRILIWGRL